MKRRAVSLGTKFALMVVLSTTIVIAVSSLVLFNRFRMQAEARSRDVASASEAHIVAAVRLVFESAFQTVDATRDSLVALKDEGIVDPHVYDTILKHMIDPDRYGAWLVWDHADAPRIDDARSTAAAPLAVYWHQNGMEMLRDVVPAEILASDLYKVPRDGKAYLLEPHSIDAINGDATLVTSFSQPLEHNGGTVGAIAVDIKLDAMSGAIGAITLPVGTTIAIVSDGGTVAVSSLPGAAGRPVAALGADFASLFAEGRLGEESLTTRDGAYRASSKIRFAGVDNPWYLLLRMPERSFLQASTTDRIVLMGVAAATLLSVLAFVFLALNVMVLKPLGRLSAIINGLGAGLFAFAVPGRDRMDEVGEIARAVERLQESGLEIARMHEANGEREHQRQTGRRAELDSISAQFSASIQATIVALDQAAADVEARSREVATATLATTTNLGKVRDASVAAKTTMRTVASSTSSLSKTIDAIGDRTRGGRLASEKVERFTASTTTSIGHLRLTIRAIEPIATLIREVAEQINLISLNATIEAARAGEAGRGFAIVAQEIKVLASRTAQATETISAHIAAVQVASGRTDMNVCDMTDAFAEMRTMAGQIADALEVQLGAASSIDVVVAKALLGADDVEQSVSVLVQSSDQVKGAADIMLSRALSLGGELTGLSRKVDDFLRFLEAA